MLGTLRRGSSLAIRSSLQELRRNFARTTCIAQGEKFSSDSNTIDADRKKASRMKTGPRRLSTLNIPSVPIAISGTAVNKEECREFMAVFPDLVRDLTDAGRHLDVPDVTKWFSKVLQYNVPNGKKNRGLALVYAYRMLASKDQLTEENIRLAQIMGWCVEMLHAFLIVVDDVMDNSVTRRGRPCWYIKTNVGTAAVNDGILLEAGIYQLLRRHFRDKPYYMFATELFHDVTLKTSIGQALDLQSSPVGKKPLLDKFTMDRFNAIAKYKTAYYSFHLPVALAMYMAGFMDEEMHRQAKTILLEMGHFYQVQDDYLDCFGDPAVTGKVGTDIQDGKCTWLVVVALQRATPAQRAVLEECYGSNDPLKIEAVKELYEQLGLPSTYAIYEEESYNIINTHIQQISRGMPHQLFFKFMEKIYRREC